jgi:hypothetical protein
MNTIRFLYLGMKESFLYSVSKKKVFITLNEDKITLKDNIPFRIKDIHQHTLRKKVSVIVC